METVCVEIWGWDSSSFVLDLFLVSKTFAVNKVVESWPDPENEMRREGNKLSTLNNTCTFKESIKQERHVAECVLQEVLQTRDPSSLVLSENGSALQERNVRSTLFCSFGVWHWATGRLS